MYLSSPCCKIPKRDVGTLPRRPKPAVSGPTSSPGGVWHRQIPRAGRDSEDRERQRLHLGCSQA